MSSYLPDVHRMLPQSPEAEQGVLSSLLLSPLETFSLCEEAGLDSRWFHIPAHAEVYIVIREILESHAPTLDFIRLTQILRDKQKLEPVGGAGFITSLWTFLPTAANAQYYIDMARDKFRLREIIACGTEFAARCYDEQEDAEGLAAQFEGRVLALSEGAGGRTADPTNKELVQAVVANVQQLYDNRGKITGIETGFTAYDRLTNGLHAEEMTVFAARPGVGKTAFALAITEHCILRLGVPVVFVSLEMSPVQLMSRLVMALAKVNAQRVRDGMMSERDFPALTKAAQDLADSLVRIIDTGETGGTIQKIRAKTRAKVRELRKAGYTRVVFIGDYLQLMTSSGKKATNREQEVAEVSRNLKMMSKELKIPVVALAQINRSSVKEKRRPKISDLRESGSIEQDADNIGLLIRAEMDCEPDDPDIEALRGQAEIDIAKQRNGPANETIKLTYIKEFARFENRAYEPQ